ncbi:MAG: hypothetical protein QXV47_07315 [Fervidicoccaceae archaeon]
MQLSPRDKLEWILTDAKQLGLLRNPKRELIDYIQQMMALEGRQIKRDSIRRQLDRIIAHYMQTGAQARSGKTYMKYIDAFLKELHNKLPATGLVQHVAAEFLTLEDARIYAEGVPVLLPVPNPRTGLITVYRLHSHPATAAA